MVSAVPFSIRRIWLLAGGTLVDRDRPRFAHLSSINDPERFVWATLPHTARSFAASILFLPEEEARTAAVGYLYARMLDTYEDLSSSPTAARRSLSLFADRFATNPPGAAPPAPEPTTPDPPDRVHLLLIERYRLVDDVFMQLSSANRRRIVRLVENMASAMIDFSRIFERQGGVLDYQQQVLDYCHGVIGAPALFVLDLVLGHASDEQARDALEVSELIQLANITRDMEKDLQRGVAYHPALRPHLGSDGNGVAAGVVASARRDLVRLATRRAPSFHRLVDAVDLPRLSSARAAAVLMMLFTSRHYRDFADVGEMPGWSSPRRVSTMLLTSLPAAFSPWWADQVFLRIERELLATV